MPHIFVSYSSPDRVFAEVLSNNLIIAGCSPWFAGWEIVVGDSIIRRIQDGIGGLDNIIAIMSHNSVNSKWVREELAMGFAVAEEKGASGLLLRLDDCELPVSLQNKICVDFNSGPAGGFATLIKVVNPDVGLGRWYDSPQASDLVVLASGFREKLGRLREDEANFPESAQRYFEDAFVALRDRWGIPEEAYPYYIAMCIEYGRWLDYDAFIGNMQSFIDRHPESLERFLGLLINIISGERTCR